MTQRDQIRSGALSDTLSRVLVAACLVGLLALGCSDSRPSCYSAPTADRSPGRHVRTSRGVLVWAPKWLRDPLLTESLLEIDAAGVPPHFEVVIRDPGSFSTSASPTGLARGMTDMKGWIQVAFRMAPHETTPLLPALVHEMGHVTSQDPRAGH
jgi:hypothetical protein